MTETDEIDGPAIGQPDDDDAGRTAFDLDDLDWIEQRLAPEHRVELERYRLEHDRALRRHGHVPMDKLTFWHDQLLFLPWRWGDDFPLSVARNAAVRLYYQLVELKLAENLWNEWEAQEARAAARIGLSVNPAQPSPAATDRPAKPKLAGPPQPKPKPVRGLKHRRNELVRQILRERGMGKEPTEPGDLWLLTDAEAEQIPTICKEEWRRCPHQGKGEGEEKTMIDALRDAFGRVTGR
jgi:hypothetical protein